MNNCYVLLTAAKNEEKFIEATIKAVVSQTVLPDTWIIVSDGSTDGTDRIALRYAEEYHFIKFVRRQSSRGRSFGSKAIAINEAYAAVKERPHSYVGVLDADVTFDPCYFERLMDRCNTDSSVGIRGGRLYEKRNGRYVPQRISTDWSVSGPVQCFRRECFERIGGYLPLRAGIDATAEVMARMNGWRVETCRDIRAKHHRVTGGAGSGRWRAALRRGATDYSLGYHPLFFALHAVKKMPERPMFLGTFLMAAGYLSEALRTGRPAVPGPVVKYLRSEQLSRLRGTLNLGRMKRRGPDDSEPIRSKSSVAIGRGAPVTTNDDITFGETQPGDGGERSVEYKDEAAPGGAVSTRRT